MLAKDKKTVIFDLGNTLVYRVKEHLVFDQELIRKLFNFAKEQILDLLVKHSSRYPGVYEFNKDNYLCRNLLEEDVYNKNFFFGSV